MTLQLPKKGNTLPEPSAPWRFISLPTDDFVIFDAEGDGLIMEASRLWCITAYVRTGGEWIEKKFHPLKEGNGEGCDHLVWEDEFVEFFKKYQDFTWIGHNVLGYDCWVIERLILNKHGLSFKKVIDTSVLSRLFRPDSPYKTMFPTFEMLGLDTRVGGHSLKAWGKRLGEEKQEFDDFTQFTFEQLDYCLQDCRTNIAIYRELCKEQNLYRFSLESIMCEMRAHKRLTQQKVNGFTLDVRQATSLQEATQKLKDEYTKELLKIFPPKRKDLRTMSVRMTEKKVWDGKSYVENPETGRMVQVKTTKLVPHKTDLNTLANNLHEQIGENEYILYEMVEFNPDSPQQIGDRLQDLGWVPTKLTETGQPSVGKDVLPDVIKQLAKKHPEVAYLEKYSIISDRLSKVTKWFEYCEADGRMHGDVFHIGTWTHRCSHQRENMANIASVKLDEEGHPIYGLDGNFGYESRNCWTVSHPDHRIVGCDASGIQLRALGHYLYPYDGGAYAKQVVEGDIHVVNQKAANIVDRPTAKTFIYAWLLGAGDLKIGQITGLEGKTPQEWIKENPELAKKKVSSLKYREMLPENKTVSSLTVAEKEVVAFEIKGYLTKEAFLDNLPALKRFRKKEIPEAAARGWMESIDGRKIWVPSEHLAMGAYLQGFEAVVMKHAMVIWQDQADEEGIWYEQKSFVHDEWQVETHKDNAERLGQIMVESITKAGEKLGLKVRLDGEYRVGMSWADSH